MKKLTQQAENCNGNLPANNHNNTAFNESISDGNVPIRDGEEAQLHQADKCNAKIHYLSRTVARQHGVIASVILTGFAYKLKYHRKNKWKDRWWYYDPIEVLRTHRWPYLSDGCICETTDYLEEKKLLIKDCNNKLSYDRTSWYAMDDEVRNTALSDLVWFDVAVAKNFKNINPGLIYHNLRYHLREILKQDPECQIPYHKLNKAGLARMLPMSESTAKRWINELVKEKLFVRHPKRRTLYTLADETEYREIRSSANAIGSSTNGSSANAIGSTVNAIGSSANDNTHYETNEKPLTNQSQKGGCTVHDNFSCDVNKTNHDKLNHANDLNHQGISDSVGSIFPGSKENTTAGFDGDHGLSINWNKLKTFNQLIEQNKATQQSLHLVDKDMLAYMQKISEAQSSYFAQEFLSPVFISQLWDVTNLDHIVEALRKPFAEYVTREIIEGETVSLTKDQWWELVYAPQLETLIRSFNRTEIFSGKYHHSMRGQADQIWSTYNSLVRKLEGEVSLHPDNKSMLLKQAIKRNNQIGWILGDGTEVKNAVQPLPAALKKIKAIFEKQPHLSVSQLFQVLQDCVDVSYSEPEPKEGFDKYWAARQGRNLVQFAQFLEKIVAELDMFSECPISL